MIVVDSAVVVDVLTNAPDTDRLRARLRDEEMHAPTLLDYEVVSALRGMTLRGSLSAARAEDALHDYGDLRVHRWRGASALPMRAFQLRNNVSAYDAAYIALTESLDCTLVTRDHRLTRTQGHTAHIELL